MSIINKLYCASLLFLVLPPLAIADEASKKNAGWKGQFSFNVSYLEGNTNTGRANLGLRVENNSGGKFSHIIAAHANVADRGSSRDSDRIETRSSRFASYQTKYALNPEQKASVVGFLSYEDDNKAKLDSHIMVGVGYERSLFNNERHSLLGSIGAGYLDVKFTDNTDGYSEPGMRGALAYKLKLTDSLSFRENFVILHSESNTLKRAKTSLSYAVTPSFSVALVNQITHNSFIPETAIDKRDDETSVNLILKF